MLYLVENPTSEQFGYRLKPCEKILEQHSEHKGLFREQLKRTTREVDNKKLFNLSFSEAMEAVFSGQYVQGEYFKWNCYLMEKECELKLCSFDEDGILKYSDHGNLILTRGVINQRYRVVSVLNRSELYHE